MTIDDIWFNYINIHLPAHTARHKAFPHVSAPWLALLSKPVCHSVLATDLTETMFTDSFYALLYKGFYARHAGFATRSLHRDEYTQLRSTPWLYIYDYNIYIYGLYIYIDIWLYIIFVCIYIYYLNMMFTCHPVQQTQRSCRNPPPANSAGRSHR
jgi:hypothetical protein